jgi:large subunit ribosomal protein L5e
MPFVKVVKNNAYFKRFQTKYRRRREGRTDYYARTRLVLQDKNKYDSPKYRLVVRISNRKIIVQVIYATLKGDKVLTSAYSTELAKYGVTTGLKNYAAAYATGLLVARRLLKQVGLDGDYEGETEATGEYCITEANEEGSNPFKVILDCGLTRICPGSRLMAVVKGASDGGLYVPHNEKNFAGYSREDKKFDAEVMGARIKGEHVSEYMTEMLDESPEKFAQLFGAKGTKKKNNRVTYGDAGVTADGVVAMYEKCHAAIRADPSRTKGTCKIDKKFKNTAKRTNDERKAAVEAKKAELQAALDAEDESDDE